MGKAASSSGRKGKRSLRQLRVHQRTRLQRWSGPWRLRRLPFAQRPLCLPVPCGRGGYKRPHPAVAPMEPQHAARVPDKGEVPRMAVSGTGATSAVEESKKNIVSSA